MPLRWGLCVSPHSASFRETLRTPRVRIRDSRSRAQTYGSLCPCAQAVPTVPLFLTWQVPVRHSRFSSAVLSLRLSPNSGLSGPCTLCPSLFLTPIMLGVRPQGDAIIHLCGLARVTLLRETPGYGEPLSREETTPIRSQRNLNAQHQKMGQDESAIISSNFSF